MAAQDLLALEPADAIAADAQQLSSATAAAVAAWPLSFTVFARSDMRPIACLGLREVDPGRAVAWAIFAHGITPYMSELVLGCRSILNTVLFRRIEVSVIADYANGHRLIKALGFELEGRLRKFDAEGRDHLMYSRIKR